MTDLATPLHTYLEKYRDQDVTIRISCTKGYTFIFVEGAIRAIMDDEGDIKEYKLISKGEQR